MKRLAVEQERDRALLEREAAQKVSGVSLAPIVAPGRNGAATAGLAFSMRF